MNEITIMYQDKPVQDWEIKLNLYIERVLSNLKIENWEMSLTICSDEYIKDIIGIIGRRIVPQMSLHL